MDTCVIITYVTIPLLKY